MVNCVDLSQVALLLNGDRSSNYPSDNDFIEYGIPFINAGHLSNGKINFFQMNYISKAKADSLSGAKITNEDILLCLRGTLGKYAFADNDEGVPASSLVVIRSNPKLINPKYLYYVVSSDIFQRQVLVENNGSSQPNLSAKSVMRFQIPYPCKKEQEFIAAVLSDIDALIDNLEKLIAKKKAIKQGTMQELLTGKRRLPGFTGEWTHVLLGNVSKIKTGDKNNEQKEADGEYPFFVRSQQVERISTYSYDGEAILVPGDGNIGQIFHYICGKFDWHQRVYKISDFSNDVCGKYVYYQMKNSFGRYALKNTVKATVDSLRLPTFENYDFAIPVIFEEQVAIANVLSDMDSEIEQLEKNLSKHKKIKSGMMSELLTGRIRLV